MNVALTPLARDRSNVAGTQIVVDPSALERDSEWVRRRRHDASTDLRAAPHWLARRVSGPVRHALSPRLQSRPELASRLLAVVRLVPVRSVRCRLYRTFSWPLAIDLAMRLEVTTAGGRMEVDTADAVGSVVAASGIWEPNITAAVRQLLAPGDVCIDVGAHVGYHTLLMSRLVEEHGHVFAFEPSPARFFELTSNLARNGSTNVTALNVAAGTDDGEASCTRRRA